MTRHIFTMAIIGVGEGMAIAMKDLDGAATYEIHYFPHTDGLNTR